ncbi:FAD-dependent oxidoreductase [Cohnella lupini]|uniref:2-polyprenyl-6-methoxyphenol hydroxylase-like FAD-dependent oxidoreductase n=1 Tax=Cohnella lupini TaxID=1294267 RepID=A0A3D9I077_9BACL|nr:NAD(P)/FAD-dependent oxidoreductase [Cohnella lupini]RED55085.1 2-polyprenyl-6-methoxyphenol hydroxylase-like FAD-dependent oxidoreductase [Cohnella lupini]
MSNLSVLNPMPQHVLIIGGGIGGLCLAQGLKQAGISVAVYERDRTPTAREQGYRIHIDPTGSQALHSCLPPALWDAFVFTAGDPGDGFGFLDEKLRKLVLVEDEIVKGEANDPAGGHHAVSRLTLRQILLAGLDDVIHFDKEFSRYEQLSNGRVTAVFTDGTTANGDLLVGVDGANSRVRRQYLPKAERVDTGAVGIGGKLELNDLSRAWLPNRITNGMNVILGPKHFLFTAIFNRRRKPEEALKLLGDKVRAAGLDPDQLFRSLENKDYILWAFITRRDDHTIEAANGQGKALQKLVGQLIEGWHPDLRKMIVETSTDTIQAFEFKTSVPIKPWESTNVTLLGDAIHSMTPAGGIGANTALRDASLLCRKLIGVKQGEHSLVQAIHSYEALMLEYGFAAVKDSMRNTKQALAGRLARITGKGFLRLCGALPPLRRAVFNDRWSDQAREQVGQ